MAKAIVIILMAMWHLPDVVEELTTVVIFGCQELLIPKKGVVVSKINTGSSVLLFPSK